MKTFKQYISEALVFGYHGRPTEFNPNVDPRTYRTYGDPSRHNYGSGFYQAPGTKTQPPYVSFDYTEPRNAFGQEKFRTLNPQILRTPMDSIKIVNAFDGEYFDKHEKFMSDLEKTRLRGFDLTSKGLMEPWRLPPGAGYKREQQIYDLTRSPWYAASRTPQDIADGKAVRSARNQFIRRLADSGFQALTTGSNFYSEKGEAKTQSVTPGAMQRNLEPTIVSGPGTGKTISLMSTRPETAAEKLAKETGAKLRDTIYLPHVRDAPKPPTPSSFEDEFNRELRSAQRQIKYVEKPAKVIKGIVKGLGVAGAVADPAGTAFQTAADAAGGRLAGALGGGLGAALFINQSISPNDVIYHPSPEEEAAETKKQERIKSFKEIKWETPTEPSEKPKVTTSSTFVTRKKGDITTVEDRMEQEQKKRDEEIRSKIMANFLSASPYSGDARIN